MTQYFGETIKEKTFDIKPTAVSRKRGKNLIGIPAGKIDDYMGRLMQTIDEFGVSYLHNLLKHVKFFMDETLSQKETVYMAASGFPVVKSMMQDLKSLRSLLDKNADLAVDLIQEFTELKQVQTDDFSNLDFEYKNLMPFFETREGGCTVDGWYREYRANISFSDQDLWLLYQRKVVDAEDKMLEKKIKQQANRHILYRYFDPEIYEIDKPLLIQTKTIEDSSAFDLKGEKIFWLKGKGSFPNKKYHQEIVDFLNKTPEDVTIYPSGRFPFNTELEKLRIAYNELNSAHNLASNLANSVKRLKKNIPEHSQTPIKLSESVQDLNMKMAELQGLKGEVGKYARNLYKEAFK